MLKTKVPSVYYGTACGNSIVDPVQWEQFFKAHLVAACLQYSE